MYLIESILLAVGLSMDSLAAAIATGVAMRDCRLRNILQIGLVVGVFHIAMMSIGFFTGDAFGTYISNCDHWIAFGLLAYLGGRMIWQGFHKKDDSSTTLEPKSNISNQTIFGMALATSIDALAVGASLAFLDVSIWTPVATVGIVTFLFSASGVYFGHRFGGKTRINFNILGGVILLGIGCKILIEHIFL